MSYLLFQEKLYRTNQSQNLLLHYLKLFWNRLMKLSLCWNRLLKSSAEIICWSRLLNSSAEIVWWNRLLKSSVKPYDIAIFASWCALGMHAQHWNYWTHIGIWRFFSIMHFHISHCLSESGFEPRTCDVQVLSCAYKATAKLRKTTFGGPHRHPKHSFCPGVVTFASLFEINHLNAFQGGSIEAPSLSFMLCAKAYEHDMKCVLPNVLLRGMQLIEMIEITALSLYWKQHSGRQKIFNNFRSIKDF